MADVFIYSLIGTALVASIISFYDTFYTFRQKCKGKQKIKHQEKIGDKDPRDVEVLHIEEEYKHKEDSQMPFRTKTQGSERIINFY